MVKNSFEDIFNYQGGGGGVNIEQLLIMNFLFRNKIRNKWCRVLIYEDDLT